MSERPIVPQSRADNPADNFVPPDDFLPPDDSSLDLSGSELDSSPGSDSGSGDSDADSFHTADGGNGSSAAGSPLASSPVNSTADLRNSLSLPLDGPMALTSCLTPVMSTLELEESYTHLRRTSPPT